MDGMALDPQLLGKDEVVVLHLRTHAKALIVPALLLLVIAVVTGVAFALLPSSWQPAAGWVAAGLALIALVVWVLVPFLQWLTSTYTFTNRRIITRRGILFKSGHDLPLSRINNVSYQRGPIDQLLGCGTLVLTTAADQPVILNDIPDVERVHVVMTELLFGGEDPIKNPTVRDE